MSGFSSENAKKGKTLVLGEEGHRGTTNYQETGKGNILLEFCIRLVLPNGRGCISSRKR
jgi:hypothetical protein